MTDRPTIEPGRIDLKTRLKEAGDLSLERLPMLAVVFDRLTSACTDNLKHLVASSVFFSFSGVRSGPFGEMLDAYEDNAVAGIFHAAEWDSHILVALDRDFIFTMVEALFGSDGGEPPVEDERPFSAIELRLANLVFEQIGKALESSFSLVSATTFRMERAETRMEFAVIGGRTNKAVEAKFMIQSLNRGGEMCVLFPQSVLNPMRPSLSKVLTGESAARDPHWTRQMAAEVQKAQVTLRAVLEERTLTLGEIADLKVGQVIGLDATPSTRVMLEGNDRPLFWCHMGQAQGSYVLRVDEAIAQGKEATEDDAAR
ncbi:MULTISPECIES: FliM/FliN family flagellar motor switch protein [unclassified Methylobacterium]|uniref:flagellar motor switch protein FliM n=1 Tax=unclassified Methylobacterium TaxID=2615210 RepID=UPI0006F67DB9|nr:MULTISPECIES: FliM/FliN family flagellar motor switch protein [unclassified Methylobacterium]KQP55207.1 flagellar motor switch protein FliM [Methylobacterium sp. Leaf108]KQT87561.1 flagellar motor switch protein FliM [Methylobacterium sp. Leaf466]